METSSVAAGANVGCDEAYTTINNAAIAVTTTTAATTISAANATTTKSASATAITIATTKTTPDTKPPSPQLTRYCSWRRIDQELQSQGLPVSYNKKNAKGPSKELVAEYLATVVEMQRLTNYHRLCPQFQKDTRWYQKAMPKSMTEGFGEPDKEPRNVI
ncbi:uncharacterized protein LOC121416449 [Lytechinus variegatus]|uniref:uncharacterized protein LOC121416449 n=1 Tax=Lytechinus variegatus TaxID=7654 RepID=UPI001BB1704D|nr:uncharacterized protein LOC121416449 [Lytechinus variegatus]